MTAAMMTITEIAGFVGAGLAGAAYAPQISRLRRTRCSAGISQLAFGTWLLASLLTTARAAAIHAGAFIMLGVTQIVATALIMLYATRYKDTPCPSPSASQHSAKTATGTGTSTGPVRRVGGPFDSGRQAPPRARSPIPNRSQHPMPPLARGVKRARCRNTAPGTGPLSPKGLFHVRISSAARSSPPANRGRAAAALVAMSTSLMKAGPRSAFLLPYVSGADGRRRVTAAFVSTAAARRPRSSAGPATASRSAVRASCASVALHPSYPLRSPRLALRPVSEQDVEALVAYRSRPDV
jgi:hypothetical protein